MELEFQLKTFRKTKTMITYDVLFQGTIIGQLILDKPYNENYAKCKTLQLS